MVDEIIQVDAPETRERFQRLLEEVAARLLVARRSGITRLGLMLPAWGPGPGPEPEGKPPTLMVFAASEAGRLSPVATAKIREEAEALFAERARQAGLAPAGARGGPVFAETGLMDVESLAAHLRLAALRDLPDG